MIDVEKIVTEYLEEQLAVSVAGTTPEDTVQSWVKVNLIGTRQVSASDQDHFNAHMIQLDCYASENGAEFQGEAADLCLAARDGLKDMPDSYDDGVVTAVRFGNTLRLPDTEFKPPRQRFILEAFVYAHP